MVYWVALRNFLFCGRNAVFHAAAGTGIRAWVRVRAGGDGFCTDEEGGGGRRKGGIFCFSFLQAARRLEEALKNLKKTRRRGGRREGGIVRKSEKKLRKMGFGKMNFRGLALAGTVFVFLLFSGGCRNQYYFPGGNPKKRVAPKDCGCPSYEVIGEAGAASSIEDSLAACPVSPATERAFLADGGTVR